jgi:hypothetical protein
MKRTIKEVDLARGICQLTFPDERWYLRRIHISENDPGILDVVPSVTWIAGHYPKGVGFYKWLASKGWDEAEEIKAAAGDKGSKVHQAIAVLLAGGTVEMEDSFENPRTLEQEPLTPSEYECLMSFADWFAETKPEVVDFEYTVWHEKFRYAGTVDLKCRIEGKVWIIDVKTSPEIWPSYEIQVSAYLAAEPVPVAERKEIKLAILQVGYRRNRRGWKFTPIRNQFRLFMAARRIWAKETAGQKPLQREYPLSLSLGEIRYSGKEDKIATV